MLYDNAAVDGGAGTDDGARSISWNSVVSVVDDEIIDSEVGSPALLAKQRRRTRLPARGHLGNGEACTPVL